MATLTIRNLPDDTYDQLRIRAAENKRSMEAEARAILAEAVAPKDAAAQRASFADEPKVWRGEVAPKPQEEKARQALESLRKMMKTVKAADGGSVVDEFLAERRKMWGEK